MLVGHYALGLPLATLFAFSSLHWGLLGLWSGESGSYALHGDCLANEIGQASESDWSASVYASP